MSSVTGSGPSPSGRCDRMDRLALASARIPFRLKVAVVWVVIFAVLGVLFWLADYDVDWMPEGNTMHRFAHGRQTTEDAVRTGSSPRAGAKSQTRSRWQ